MEQIWEKHGNPNRQRVNEIKAKYQNRAYEIYVSVCVKYSEEIQPPLVQCKRAHHGPQDDQVAKLCGKSGPQESSSSQSPTAQQASLKVKIEPTPPWKKGGGVPEKRSQRPRAGDSSQEGGTPALPIHKDDDFEPDWSADLGDKDVHISKTMENDILKVKKVETIEESDKQKQNSELMIAADTSSNQAEMANEMEDEDDLGQDGAQKKRKGKRGQRKKLTGDQRAKRKWDMLDEALEQNRQ